MWPLPLTIDLQGAGICPTFHWWPHHLMVEPPGVIRSPWLNNDFLNLRSTLCSCRCAYHLSGVFWAPYFIVRCRDSLLGTGVVGWGLRCPPRGAEVRTVTLLVSVRRKWWWLQVLLNVVERVLAKPSRCFVFALMLGGAMAVIFTQASYRQRQIFLYLLESVIPYAPQAWVGLFVSSPMIKSLPSLRNCLIIWESNYNLSKNW